MCETYTALTFTHKNIWQLGMDGGMLKKELPRRYQFNNDGGTRTKVTVFGAHSSFSISNNTVKLEVPIFPA